MDRFYMLYVEGRNSPTVKHVSPTSVEKEAARLSRQEQNRGHKVFVLKAIASCVADLPPVEWDML